MIKISLDDLQGHLVEPPIVDFLHEEQAEGIYVITFVPRDDISEEPTETVTIDRNSTDGRRVAVCMFELSRLVAGGRKIDLISHLGGGNFTFRFGNQTCALADEQFESTTTFDAYRLLQDIAQTAEVVYRINLKLAS